MSATLAPALSARERWAALPEGTRAELIDNQIIMSPSPTSFHQSIALTFASELRNFLKKRPGMGKAFIAPLDVEIAPDYILQPDVLYLSAAKQKYVGAYIQGTPDLVLEVLSPGNVHNDLVVKKNLYESHGVAEYWIVDPETQTVEVLYLAETGQYQIHQRAQSGRVESKLISGFGVELEELFFM